jgi:hypothetical protein
MTLTLNRRAVILSEAQNLRISLLPLLVLAVAFASEIGPGFSPDIRPRRKKGL